ncbi:immunity repressor [Gordonia phage Rahul]|nr:immunity repressor [Gordonia phage Rahul]
MTTATTHGVVPIEFDLPMRLELARRHAQLSQGEMAEALGVGKNTVYRAENGRPVKRATLIAWATLTGVDLNWLETGETPPPDGGGASIVRHQGLEPRTRWFGVPSIGLHAA